MRDRIPCALLFAFAALGLVPHAARAALVPVDPGWSAVPIAEGLVDPGLGIAVDPVSHDVFVVDQVPGAPVIYRITPGGTRTVIVAGAASNLGDLAFDPATRSLYVQTDTAVLRLDEFGATPDTLPGFVLALAIGSDGALYSGRPGRIDRLDPATRSWQPWRNFFGGGYSGVTLEDFCFDPGGNVFAVASMFNNEYQALWRLSPGVVPIQVSSWSGGPPVGLAIHPTGMLIGPYRLDPYAQYSGPLNTLWLLLDAGSGPVRGVATDPDGRVFVTATGSVWMITPPGPVPARTSTWGALKSRYR